MNESDVIFMSSKDGGVYLDELQELEVRQHQFYLMFGPIWVKRAHPSLSEYADNRCTDSPLAICTRSEQLVLYLYWFL